MKRNDRMSAREKKARDALVADLQNLKAPIFQQENRIFVSAEDAESYKFADYYGEYRGGYPWISDELEALAKKHGGYWEWQNPGSIVFVSN